MWFTTPYIVDVLEQAQADLDHLEKSQFAHEQIIGIQERKLGQLWKRAIITPYYVSLMKGKPENLNLIPVTPKLDVKQNVELFSPPSLN
jgi:hypothetical protein